MRTIKFRAWIDGKVYYNHSVTVQIDGTVVYLTPAGDWLTDETGLVTIEQFTGLHDKNGKEIYEGDVVKCWDNAADDANWGLDKHHTGEIVYCENCYSLKVGKMYI